MDFLNIPKRTERYRTYGLTSVVDFGTPMGELRNILADYSDMIDIAKIGIGAAYVMPNLRAKIDIYLQHGIKPYFGGTFFEKCYYQNKLPEYLSYLQELGIEWIEISNGTLDIPLQERLYLVSELKKEFHVIGEVGSKDTDNLMSIYEWKEEIRQLLGAGCDYVITEGRDSGTAGIYENNGTVKFDLVRELLRTADYRKIIFEAPAAKQQMFFIKEIGPNVNLGNVKLHDVVVLEAQRCGLRSETFFMEEHECELR